MQFEYTDAHGINQSDLFALTKFESQLLDQCRAWNTYEVQALKDHASVYFQFIKTYSEFLMSLDVIEGAKLIISSYETIGDRHYRITLSQDLTANIVIKGLGLLETSEPGTFTGESEQRITIHNKLVKIYFPLQRCYEIDFTMERLFVNSLDKGYPA